MSTKTILIFGVAFGFLLGWPLGVVSQEVFIDTDGDLWSDRIERAEGTDPFDPASYPQAQAWPDEVGGDSPRFWFRFDGTDPADPVPSQGAVSQEAFYGLEITSDHLGKPSVGSGLGNAVELTGPSAGADSGKNIDLAADSIAALTALRGGDSLEPKTTTVELWIKTSQTGSAGNDHNASPVLLGRQSEGDGQIYWGWINGSGDFGMTTSGMQEIMAERDAGYEVTDGEWHHIVMIKRWRVEEPSQSVMIIDGGENAGGATITAETPAGADSYQDEDATIRFFGLLQDGNGDDVQFVGTVDELAIYARALSEDEARLHYRAGVPDSDGDGIVDRVEVANGLDPETPDAQQDADGDGLSNIQEVRRGTNIQSTDTDEDGLGDGVETGTGDFVSAQDTGTDPTDPDSDGDGLMDGYESATGDFVGSTDTGSNPNQEDTDGDQYLDGTEVSLESSPVDAEAVPVQPGEANLLAHWDFDQTADENEVADQAHGFSGVMRNGAALTDQGGGFSGESEDRALDFGGTSEDQLLEVDNGAFLNAVSPNDHMTISFWQRWQTTPVSSSTFWLISPSSDPPNARGAQAHVPWSNGSIFFDTAGCCGGDTRISQNIGDFEGAEDISFFQEWHHFTFVKEGSTKQIWIDGELFVEGTNEAPLPRDFTSMYLGVRPQNVGNGEEGIQAMVDEFAIYASGLDRFQIKALSQGIAPGSVGSLPDADGDGIPDLAEDELGLNKDDAADGEADPDSDGLSNSEEFALGTALQESDTDGDGLEDGVETNTGELAGPEDTGTDPSEADTDGDGLLDGVETATGEFVDAEDTGTNPHNPDTDGDGLQDGVEVSLHTVGLTSDPIDPESTALQPGKPNLLAYWSFNATVDDAQVEDEVNGIVGRLENGAALTDDAGGSTGEAGDRALDLGETSEDQLLRADASFAKGTSVNDEITVTFWQKWDNEPVNSASFWFLSPSSTGNNRGAQSHLPFGDNVFWDTAGCCGGDFRLNESITAFEEAEGPAFFQDWHHYTFVKDGPTKQIWIDGMLFLEGENPASLPDDFTELLLGVRPHLIGDGNEGIQGRIDDFAVFASALRPLEIEALSQDASPTQMDALPDDDGDGMPNVYETKFGFDPTTEDGASDEDGDGLTNLEEFERGLDPTNSDMDGDGLTDGVETATGEFVDPEDTGTDPTNPDTDGDGFRDAVETGTAQFVGVDDTGTDPTNRDTDGDGLEDGVETGTGTFVSLENTGTHPVKRDSDDDGVNDLEELLSGFDPNESRSTPEIAGEPVFTRVEVDGGELTLEWEAGTLQSAEQVAGPYEDVTDATSSFSVSLQDTNQRFFRLVE